MNTKTIELLCQKMTSACRALSSSSSGALLEQSLAALVQKTRQDFSKLEKLRRQHEMTRVRELDRLIERYCPDETQKLQTYLDYLYNATEAPNIYIEEPTPNRLAEEGTWWIQYEEKHYLGENFYPVPEWFFDRYETLDEECYQSSSCEHEFHLKIKVARDSPVHVPPNHQS